MLNKLHREIVEEQKFKDQVEALGLSWKRLDEVLSGISISLAVRPEFWPKIPGTAFSVLKTLHYPKCPPLRVFFTYDALQVHLWYVEEIDASEPENHVSAETA